MTDICDLDIAGLEAATAPYRDALYHRNTFVEGIRQIAVRNLAHRHRAKVSCGYSEGLTEDGFEDVATKMLEDQKLENSQVNRNTLVIATFVPIQIYLCLFYASIKFYQDTSSKRTFYKDKDMDDCIARHADVVATLGEFRDSFLHPTGNHEVAQRAFLRTKDSYNVTFEIQVEFDAYLERIRQKLIALFQQELARLPEVQRMYCALWAFPWVAERMTECHDPDGMKEWKKSIDRFTHRIGQIPEAIRSWRPNKQEHDAALRIAQCTYEISPSAPERYYPPIDPEENQTPFPGSALVLKLAEPGFEEGPQSLDLGSRHEAHLFRAMYPLTRLLFATYVLLNETVHVFRTFPHGGIVAPDAPMVPLGDVRKIAGLQRAKELLAPLTSMMALLYEPLRLYREAAAKNPDFRSEALEEYLAIPGREVAHRHFRNSVFHVVPNAEMAERELQATEAGRTLGTYPAVISELSRLFFRHPSE
ncbi:MAG: hypothetical protein OXM58_05905 [Rhodospirillaceae bacterium]|nr:hypothetical protein [Rhodospirillaceae bacterium]MDE0619132.1 hypothetical protein [Rhodospirillaceae bacterium]